MLPCDRRVIPGLFAGSRFSPRFSYHCTMRTTATPVQIRFADVDRLGHVNNAFYLSYIELARMHYFEEAAGGIDWDRLGVIVARVEIDYLAPVLLDDKVHVKTWCSRTGTKSFDLSYSIMKSTGSGDLEAARALTVMVCYDYTARRSVPIPAEWLVWLKGTSETP
jgi:acyl-CoA thioester hydrolase